MTTKILIAGVVVLAVLFMARKLFVFALVLAVIYLVYQYVKSKVNEPEWYDVTQYF